MSENIDSKKFRYYQQEADDAIYEELRNSDKCIVKMFCGTGKSILMRKCKIVKNQKLVVYVFPSLSLIEQFCNDYFVKVGLSCPFKISSENNSTTDPLIIKAELKKKKNKIICVTYQSYDTLLKNLGSNKIDVCIYDEAHHAVGETYQKLIFEQEKSVVKQIFFTATPKNANDIIMYDRNNLEAGMCGKLVYDYSYLQGLNDEYVNPFQIRVDMYTENTNKSIYESIARAVLISGNNRVLTFHSDVNTDRDASVINFVKESEFIRAFMKVLTNEFPEKEGLYTKFKMIGLYSTIEPERRKILLSELDATSDNEVYIISSCETIGEGIDTKKANMCVFVDPKSSFVKIIQNIGRIVRRQSKSSTVLIPCWVDKDKYIGCDGDREKCDEVIRSDLNKDGNFNGILNVLSALRQENEDLYYACLNYGKDIDDKSNYSSSIINSDSEDEYSENSDSEDTYPDSEDSKSEVKQKHKINISFHTNDEIKVLWKITSDIDIMKNMCSCVLECEVISNEDMWFERFEELKKFIDENKRRPNLSSNNNNEKLMARWFINNTMTYKNKNKGMLSETRYSIWSQFKEEYKEYFIDYEEKWIDTLDKLKTFIDENKRKPMPLDRHKSKNTEYSEENKLGEWVSGNQKCFNNKTGGMKNISRYNLWNTFLCDYSTYYKKNDDKWIEQFNNLKYFFDTNKKRPNKDGTNLTEKKLGNWMTKQIKNYKNKLQIMKVEDTYNLWTNLMSEYTEYFGSDEDKWKNNLLQVDTYISINKERPSYSSYLDHWLIDNKQSYINKTWMIQERYKLWETFMQKNYQYIMSSDERWESNFNELIMFINSNKKTPVQSSVIGVWFGNQKTHYKNKTSGMNEKYRYDKWTQFLEEYAEYLLTETELWFLNFEKLKKYISLNSKLPNKRLCDEKKIGNWLSMQKINYKNKTRKMKDPEIYTQWTQFLEEYKQYFDNTMDEEPVETPKPKKSMKLKEITTKEPSAKKETSEERKQRTESELSVLHQRYKTLNSKNLQKEFQETPELWHQYHAISEENEKSFPEESIPRNRIIQELTQIKTKRTRSVVDMGCGKAQIAEHFANDTRFTFTNYDHVSSKENVLVEDISNTGLEDDSIEICILCLAMWGSNCEDYVREAYRILDSGGNLYIIEPTIRKRWTDEGGPPAEKLKILLEKSGFKIIKSSVEKFCMFVCVKV
jgi:superfamily II DNA or RNA helicase